jgi:hypothetical protein
MAKAKLYRVTLDADNYFQRAILTKIDSSTGEGIVFVDTLPEIISQGYEWKYTGNDSAPWENNPRVEPEVIVVPETIEEEVNADA